tara:strand:- start:697 stop:1866 length:1170 start_codon:yes stop_codon:yes gene_type:complete
MGILDFFRKKKVVEIEAEPEEISFDEVESWLDVKKEEISRKEAGVFDLINEKIDLFVIDINGKVKLLEEVDVESKRVDNRAKVIVRQSLEKYLSFVNIFITGLKKIEKQNLSEFIKDINKIFSDFDKHSYGFYQKATFLIGDEIAAVKTEINNLSKYFTTLFSENQKIVDSSNVISSVKLKLKELDNAEKNIEKIGLEIESLENKIADIKEKEKKILHEIKEVKKSKDYLENLKRKEEIKLMNKQIEDDILKLKILVDFKALSSVFHSNENKMKLVKSYRDDFQDSIARDNGLGLLTLMKEAELDNKIIADKIREINEKKQKLAKEKKLIKKDEIKTLLAEVEKVKSEIEDLSIEKVRHARRSEDVEAGKVEIKDVVGAGVVELGGRVV